MWHILLRSHCVVFEDFHRFVYIICHQTLIYFDTTEKKFWSSRPHVWEQFTFHLKKRRWPKTVILGRSYDDGTFALNPLKYFTSSIERRQLILSFILTLVRPSPLAMISEKHLRMMSLISLKGGSNTILGSSTLNLMIITWVCTYCSSSNTSPNSLPS